MKKLTKNQLLQKSKKFFKPKNLGEITVKENQVYKLTEPNAFIQKLTLKAGSKFLIDNLSTYDRPVSLEIDNLNLDINGPAALISFFDPDDINLTGETPNPSGRGPDGYRHGGQYYYAQKPGSGRPGYAGGHGETIPIRGKLFLYIHKLTTPPRARISRRLLSFDAKGVNGGNGGNGGIGGAGGNGAPGRTGRHDCNWRGYCRCSRDKRHGTSGARGGAGGTPGNGGDAGSGAEIYIKASDRVIKGFHRIIDLKAGAIGKGGVGGKGGKGGKGAGRTGGGNGHCGRTIRKKPDGAWGTSKQDIRGKDGQPGKEGKLLKIVRPRSYENIIREELGFEAKL